MLSTRLRRKFLAAVLLSAAVATSFATVAKPMPLWPAKAPGETAELPVEANMTKAKDRVVAGKAVVRIGNVSSPTMTVYSPEPGKANGAAVIVMPGGGYSILAIDLEGTEVCEWFNSIGVTAVLLKYRVPKRVGLEKHAAPLQDAQRAVGLVRSRAAAWGIDPKRIGVLGFSAGGHLAAVVSNQHGERTYPVVDDAEKVSCRPDFAVLIYPAYLTVKDKNDAIAPELPVSETNTPPTFIAQTEDDSVRVETGLFYYLALKNAKVPAEMHLYPRGGHGYGLRRTENDVTSWPDRVNDWMKTSGFLEAKR
jgi:acetyl esterase/lipase